MRRFALPALVAGLALTSVGAAAQSMPGQLAAPPVPNGAPLAATPRLTIAQLRQRYGDAQSRYITIRGVEVHYKDEGRGPVLVLIHGSQSSLRTWDVETALLKGRYRVIRFDIPGYGLSGRISDEVAAKVQPTDIAEDLLEHLKVRRATVVGVSSGGTMAMFLAAKRPELVERLILSNTPSDPVKYDHLVEPPAFIEAQARAKQLGGFQDQDFWNQYLWYFSGDPARYTPRLRREYYDFNRRTPEKHPIALVARIGDGKQAAIEMAKIRCPVFLIWGTADPLLPEAAADALTRYLANARISRVLMPDVGHYPPVEVPERFARLMAVYIEVVTPRLKPNDQPAN